MIFVFRPQQEPCRRLLCRTCWWQWHLQVGGGDHRTSGYSLVSSQTVSNQFLSVHIYLHYL